jgi:hypothetical protein
MRFDVLPVEVHVQARAARRSIASPPPPCSWPNVKFNSTIELQVSYCRLPSDKDKPYRKRNKLHCNSARWLDPGRFAKRGRQRKCGAVWASAGGGARKWTFVHEFAGGNFFGAAHPRPWRGSSRELTHYRPISEWTDA